MPNTTKRPKNATMITDADKQNELRRQKKSAARRKGGRRPIQGDGQHLFADIAKDRRTGANREFRQRFTEQQRNERFRRQANLAFDSDAFLALELGSLERRIAMTIIREFAVSKPAGGKSPTSIAITKTLRLLTSEQRRDKEVLDKGIQAARDALQEAHQALISTPAVKPTETLEVHPDDAKYVDALVVA